MRNAWVLMLAVAGCGVEQATGELAPSAAAVLEREALEVTDFGANPGALRLFLYAPSAPKAGAGLVVALHGCAQTVADYQQVGWNALAERYGFYVLYAQASAASGCFRWFEPGHASRGQGESASVVGGVDWVLRRYAVDRRRVFVTGLSAGAAMTAALLASSPDVFSAGSLFAGVPAGCATTMTEGLKCQAGVDLSAQTWASRAQAQWPVTPAGAPRVQVWAGSADTTVSPSMARELAEQWTALNGIDAVSERSETVGQVKSEEHRRDGELRVQVVTLSGFGHAVPVKTSSGCGSTGAFVRNAEVCGALEAARFFGLLEAEVVAPVVEVLDAGSATVIIDGGVMSAGPVVGTCKASVATPTWHAWLRHGEVCGFFGSLVCAVGSGELLGPAASSVAVSAYTLGDGTWRAGACP